jgi:hypothetical protein
LRKAPEQVATELQAECDALNALPKPVAAAAPLKKTGKVAAG